MNDAVRAPQGIDYTRRRTVERMTPAECAISNACSAVEDMPADVRLTRAATLLQQAWDEVADFTDGVPTRSLSGAGEPRTDVVPSENWWVCANGHAGRNYLKSEAYGGDVCLTCRSPVRLYTLAFPASRSTPTQEPSA